MPRSQPAKNPQKVARNRAIAEKRLQGATYRDLSKEFSVATSTLATILSLPEQQEVLEIGTQQLVKAIPKAVDNLINFAMGSDPKLRMEGSKEILDRVGISKAHTPANVYIQNLYQQNIQQQFTHVALQAAAAYLGGKVEPELEAILDAEVEETGPEKDKQV